MFVSVMLAVSSAAQTSPAAASAARVHLSEHAKTGPMEPPMFCMLLRKYLCGGRVLAVRRIAGDRILEIDISNLSELGDPVTRTMVVEIMGRHSNIILRAADGRIVDAVRHVGQDISRVRQVLPGLTYAYPPAQGKLNPETATAEEIALRLAQEGGKLVIALHIKVGFGLNISTITQSITHRVKDEVELATGLKVARIDVYVDDVIAD